MEPAQKWIQKWQSKLVIYSLLGCFSSCSLANPSH